MDGEVRTSMHVDNRHTRSFRVLDSCGTQRRGQAKASIADDGVVREAVERVEASGNLFSLDVLMSLHALSDVIQFRRDVLNVVPIWHLMQTWKK